jgi:hypothetical protein
MHSLGERTFGDGKLILMIALLASASAAVDNAPSKGHPIGSAADWVRAEDFSSSEWNKAAVTTYDLMVDPNGIPVSCVVTGTSGSDEVDKVACSSLMARARFFPARDGQGDPIAEARHGHIRWHPEKTGSNQYSTPPEILVKTPLITDLEHREHVTVDLIYDDLGDIEQCIAVERSGISQLNADACTIASKTGTFGPVRGGRGEMTRGLRDIDLVFIKGESEQVTMF